MNNDWQCMMAEVAEVMGNVKQNTMGQPIPPNPLDEQHGGDHYKQLGHYQPWEVAAAWLTPEELRGAMKFTVISYIAREQMKGGDLDINKAMHTIQLWNKVRKDTPNV